LAALFSDLDEAMAKILPVIMCGGSGTRMWPESRESLPKQFLPLLGPRSTFQNTVAMLASSDAFERPVILTNHDYRFLVAEQLAAIGALAEIVIEPIRRDSAAAVAMASELAALMGPDTILAALAADHAVQDPQKFLNLCPGAARAAAAGRIVTLGIKPTHPATGYGYIRVGAAIAGSPDAFEVAAFVEKPDEETAKRYIAEGYLWNSGNFIFRADVMKAEIARFEPAVADAAARAVALSKTDLQFRVLDEAALASAPKKSIDYAVMEHTKLAAVVPADMGWSDVGAWSSVLELSERDAHGNAVMGQGMALDATNVLIRSPDHLTAVVGVSNVIVVTTQDAVLVLDAGKADKVKELVEKLKREGRREALEHKRVYRPWGYYQSIDHGDRYQVKRIVVKPGGRLSLQKHFHRAEHWVVVRGVAEVTCDETISLVQENQSIYLPLGSVHRLANPGKIDIELIEVQTGSYLGEDDIVRIEDVYHRN
jgi:mannose-1-phosphate guanylyltransferase/mannose-6-phosphate isomerase